MQVHYVSLVFTTEADGTGERYETIVKTVRPVEEVVRRA